MLLIMSYSILLLTTDPTPSSLVCRHTVLAYQIA